MSDIPFVSIIIPALNEESNIKRCVESIQKVDSSGCDYEIIVVDNGSTDKTVEVAKDLEVRVFIKTDINIAGLRNFGVTIAQGNIFAFVDADCVVAKEWLQEALRELSDKQVGATGSNYKLYGKGSWVSRAWEFNKKTRKDRCEVEWIQSGNLIIKKESFDAVGGFDEQLNVCEDSDICYRIKDKGYKIVSNKAIGSYHLGFAETLITFFKKQLWYGKDVLRVFFKSKNKKKYFKSLSLPLFFLLCIFVFCLSILLVKIKLMVLAVVTMFIVSFIWAMKVNFEKKRIRYIIPLTLLFFVFGIARAICLIDVRNWSRG